MSETVSGSFLVCLIMVADVFTGAGQTACSLVFTENPLHDFAELPPHLVLQRELLHVQTRPVVVQAFGSISGAFGVRRRF